MEVDVRTMRTVMTRAWEAWATGDLDGFDAGVMESCEEGSTRRRGRKRALADDEMQLALRCARADGLDVALGMVNDLRKAKRGGCDGKFEWNCCVDIDDPSVFVPRYIDGDPQRPNPRARVLDTEARPKAKFEDECRFVYTPSMSFMVFLSHAFLLSLLGAFSGFA
jgi:hypothetical protein